MIKFKNYNIMKLISMTDFVLEQNIIQNYIADFEKSVINYAKFLKKPLTIGMFVPCDEEGNVLNIEDPNYEEAKEKVLFNDIEYISFNTIDKSYQLFDTKENHIFWMENYGTIEDYIYYNLQLTKSAIKKIGI